MAQKFPPSNYVTPNSFHHYPKKKLIDRLPIIISYIGLEQPLSVPKLISSTGEKQATAVYQAFGNWGIIENVQAICYDTTAFNIKT